GNLHFRNRGLRTGQSSQPQPGSRGEGSDERSSVHWNLLQAVFITISMNCVHGDRPRGSERYAASSSSSPSPSPPRPRTNVPSFPNFEICCLFHVSGRWIKGLK